MEKEKLKDLYLSDLIDRDMYERDYKALKAELDDVPAEEARIDPADISGALSLYASLDRPQRKAFWSRTISNITVSISGDFFVRLS